jgi:hypothetical protein
MKQKVGSLKNKQDQQTLAKLKEERRRFESIKSEMRKGILQ